VRTHTGPGDVTLARAIETPAYGSTTNLCPSVRVAWGCGVWSGLSVDQLL